MSQASLGDPRVRSYMTLRQAVGYLGILLPLALAAGNWLIFAGGMQKSVSDYFYTGMRGVLVGGLCIIGAFLLAYRGDDKWDGLFTTTAGIGAVGVALFPTPPPHPSVRAAIFGYCHYASGSLLFISLTVLALWLFRRTGQEAVRSRLRQLRNHVYLACGIVMVVSLALAGIASLPLAARLSPLDPVFWMETAATAAFGVSWLVKGQAILRDRHLPGRPVLRA
ncbi:MAG TPA: DUF998 domain-containing protein [Streptosporangiaceae bacterium]